MLDYVKACKCEHFSIFPYTNQTHYEFFVFINEFQCHGNLIGMLIYDFLEASL